MLIAEPERRWGAKRLFSFCVGCGPHRRGKIERRKGKPRQAASSATGHQLQEFLTWPLILVTVLILAIMMVSVDLHVLLTMTMSKAVLIATLVAVLVLGNGQWCISRGLSLLPKKPRVVTVAMRMLAFLAHGRRGFVQFS